MQNRLEKKEDVAIKVDRSLRKKELTRDLSVYNDLNTIDFKVSFDRLNAFYGEKAVKSKR